MCLIHKRDHEQADHDLSSGIWYTRMGRASVEALINLEQNALER